MKKILFRKLLSDCSLFFLITLLSSSLIIWIFQAVNFLDILIEDGRDYWVYFSYTLLNLPKTMSKLLPFAFFFSFFYVISKYELNKSWWFSEFWGIKLIKFFYKIFNLLTILQIVVTSIIVPKHKYWKICNKIFKYRFFWKFY